MRCASCGFENPEGLKFCNECGTSLKRRCAQCGFENAPQAKFCGECGTALTGLPSTPGLRDQSAEQGLPATPRAAVPRAAEAERRQLTVMFCDLVGSTPLSQQLDPEELRAVIQAYREACASVIRRFDGYLAKYIGDGWYSHPTAASRSRGGLDEYQGAPSDRLSAALQSYRSIIPTRRPLAEHPGVPVVVEFFLTRLFALLGRS